MSNKNNHVVIIFGFYCVWFLWTILSLSACNQTTKNVTPAGTSVSGEVTLLWNEIPGAISYNVYVSHSPGVTKLSRYKISNVKNPFKVIHFEIGETYYFVVTVVYESGESKESKELSYTPVADKMGLIYFKDLFDK